ncbi:MAG TPA: TonB-dependent receptor [Dyella sp.]|uniref:TonB-dependent receptor n=1 Tax=Dyella sp. TaxID=1869338 RepID=UPI002B61AFAD|nr:TonB-dependent receptor [Dyella sp.]HTV85004.1 TonB-dependent receptor [Dyella sp.]
MTRRSFAAMLCAAMPLLPISASATAAGASEAPRHLFKIQPGDLRSALDALASQGDVQIVYSPDLAAGKTTRGVAGRFTPVDALRQLLAGTGLGWKTAGEGNFVLEPLASPRAATMAPARAIALVPRTLDAVNVSGSLIGNAAIQTATPTYTISAQDIKLRGFTSIADVLENSVLATGSVQGQQTAGSFTQGAQPVSLFGLGPQFTLILVDGKPIADFGRLYNGTFNFTSIANLPIAIVDHIDVMPGGASSIYGSQAIGGVINIVTRSNVEGGELSVRTGTFSDGGGANQRVSFVFGRTFGPLRVTGAAEFDNASPIWGYQRPLTVGTRSGPSGAMPPSVQAGILDYGTAATFTGEPLGYLSPPAGCDNHLFANSTVLSQNPAVGQGQYCGSDKLPGYVTFGNQSRNYDGMLKLDDRVSEQLRLYSDIMLNWQQQRWFPGVPAWFPDDLPEGAIEDAATGHYLYLEKFFAPEEMPGGAAGQMYRQSDLLYQADLGANGHLGDSGWDWDIYFLRTGDRTEVVEPLAITSRIDAFFYNILGPVVGVDPASGLNMYNPNYKAFFAPVTPAQYASFTQGVGELSNTWINNTRATLSNPALFALPGGDAGFAALLEGGSEAWYEPLNPLYTQDAVFEHAATGGGGQRAHGAAAFELNLPWLPLLTLDLSGRYDRYALEQGSDNHKFTYKAGLEFRPTDSFLVRGNYTTSFKAPDLSAIFLGPTDYYTTITDYYQCALAHASTCGSAYQYGIRGTTLPNTTLQPTTAQSWSVGTVWSPVNKVSFSVDYLHIAIRDEVVQQDIDTLIRTDAQCLLGQLNPESVRCLSLTNATNGQVQRALGTGPITGITTYYANLANEVTGSIVGSARYGFSPWHIGSFDLQLDYNDMLRHQYQLASGQVPINNLANPQYSTEFKSIVSGSIAWTSPNGRWSGALYGHRYGPSPNYLATNDGAGVPGAGRLSPWITFNTSVSYRPTRSLELSMLVNNLANKMPPSDPTYTAYPYFNYDNYNVYGREFLLQMELKFGAGARGR